MWYQRPRLRGFAGLLPQHLLEILVPAYALVQAGNVQGVGPERGRAFENVFYRLCGQHNFRLTERAGARTLGGQAAGSGFWHEVDGASRNTSYQTHWELKYLGAILEKNELLIFNDKGLDFLRAGGYLTVRTPLYRILLSGSNLREEARRFAVQWGIIVVEPDLLPLPLIYEAVARGAGETLRRADCDAVNAVVPWACRPAQAVLGEMAAWCLGEPSALTDHNVLSRSNEALDLQEQIGKEVLDYLDDEHPDWQDHLIRQVWSQTGRW